MTTHRQRPRDIQCTSFFVCNIPTWMRVTTKSGVIGNEWMTDDIKDILLMTILVKPLTQRRIFTNPSRVAFACLFLNRIFIRGLSFGKKTFFFVRGLIKFSWCCDSGSFVTSWVPSHWEVMFITDWHALHFREIVFLGGVGYCSVPDTRLSMHSKFFAFKTVHSFHLERRSSHGSDEEAAALASCPKQMSISWYPLCSLFTDRESEKASSWSINRIIL